MFSSSIGHPGPFGLPPILLATTLLFLLIAFPSAGVVGQEGGDPSDSSKKSNGAAGGLTPRHKLFEEYKGKKSAEATQAFNYVCMQFRGNEYVEKDPIEEDRQFCGCMSKGAEKSQPEKFQYPVVNVEGCLNAFYRIAMMPMCGNEWFDQMKLCALTQFFDDKADFEAVKNDANKKTLLLIDGCALCDTPAQITKIEVVHTEEAAGGLLSQCNEQEQTDLTIQSKDGKEFKIDVLPGGLSVNTSSFTVPVVLYHRVCGQVFSDAAVSDKFVGIKLKITHNCGGAVKEIIVDLPDVDRTAAPFSDHFVGELRGLQIDLKTEEIQQYKLKEGEGMPKYVAEGKPSGWNNANVKCWTREPKEQNCELIY